jgi:formylglycine-generating enzyme required for sulfatase activity
LCPVDSHPHGATPEGVFDMAGNIFELCRDTYKATWRYSDTGTVVRDPVSLVGSQSIVRGCDHRMSESTLRNTWRVGCFTGAHGLPFMETIVNMLSMGRARRQSVSITTLARLVATALVGFRCVAREVRSV